MTQQRVDERARCAPQREATDDSDEAPRRRREVGFTVADTRLCWFCKSLVARGVDAENLAGEQLRRDEALPLHRSVRYDRQRFISEPSRLCLGSSAGADT